jgi:hypothetical protein
MRKFKLIKEYPGSGAVGTISQPNDLLQHDFFEKYSEFWQEVIEKEFEILISRVVPQEILSIKRLSDGEIFTVGDKFKANIGGSDVIRTIQKIQVEGDAINIQHENGDLTNRKCVGIFNQIKKVKQPIFLTHNGIDIFEGDTVWYVNKENLYHDYAIALARTSFNSNTHAYFLTREGAEGYIEKNKVLFTTEDGVGIKKGDMIHGVYRTTNTISNTVVGNNNGVCNPFIAVFSTRAAAENYLVQKSHSLSIEDFWEFDSWGGSVIAKSKRLKRLVKERLNLK